MTTRRRGKRGGEDEELDEEELVADLRRRAASWFAAVRERARVVEAPPFEIGPPSVEASAQLDTSVAPANDGGDPSSNAGPQKQRRRQRRDTDGAAAMRRKAWWWLRPSVSRVLADQASSGTLRFRPEAVAPPGKRKRARRDAQSPAGPAPGVIDLRTRSWAWFAPRTVHAGAQRGEHVVANEVVRGHLKGVLEALIFASEHPLPAKELARIAGADLKLVRALLTELVAEYQPRGVRLDEIAGGFVFRTSPAFAPFVREQVAKKPVKMTRAQIETLAIVAYRQPITRPEIDDVRGVDSGAVLKSLLEREFVRILGKKDEPGRPMLYGTTPSFLEFFGLKALGDLPTLREFTELNDESKRAYERAMEEHEEGLMGGEGAMKAPTPPEPGSS